MNYGLNNIERLISIFKVGTLKEDKCVIPKLKVSLQGLTTTEHRSGIELIRRSAGDRDQGLMITRLTIQKHRTHIFIYLPLNC